MAEAKQSIVGIAIPEECGKAEMYEITAIMYHDANSDKEEIEYQVFITKEDFEKAAPFATIKANMNPEVLLFPDDKHEGIGCLQYDLVEASRIRDTEDGKNAIIISELVDESDSRWIMVEDNCIDVQTKTVRMNDNEISIDEMM